MAGEVTWEDESDVREIIADVRDAECEMTWCVSRTRAPLLPTGGCDFHASHCAVRGSAA